MKEDLPMVILVILQMEIQLTKRRKKNFHQKYLNNQILKDDFEKYKTRLEKSITDDEKNYIKVEDDETVPIVTKRNYDGKKISNCRKSEALMLQLIKAKKNINLIIKYFK